MGFFSDLASKSFAPVKSGATALYDTLTPGTNPSGPYAGGALMDATAAEGEKKKFMPSITELGMQAMDPNYKPDAKDMTNLGRQAMSGTPVFTDSTRETAFGSEEGKGKKFDLEALGAALNSIKAPESSGSSSVSSGRVGGGFRFDKSLYEDPLLAREYQNLYMEPLYKSMARR